MAEAFTEDEKSWLQQLECRIVHVRLRADRVEEAPGHGCNTSLVEEAPNFFSQWCDTAYPGEKQEVLVIRPDKYIFGVYKHTEANMIVSNLKNKLWSVSPSNELQEPRPSLIAKLLAWLQLGRR